MSYPHSTDPLVIEKAQTDYLLAKKVYKEALSVYNKLKKRNLTDPERARALTNLLAAKQRMDQALATYNWYILDYTPSDIAQADGELAVAQANLEKAQADWENLKDGSSSAVIAMAEASLADAQREWERVKDGPSEADLAAAQADIDAAQAELNDAYLLAPFAGTITKVDVSTGDLVSAGDAAFRIDDLSSIFIDIQISEVDLASLRVGQKATLEFDAIADKQYTGELSEIGMIGTNSQGVVNYPATVRVTDADEDVLPGMTASVTIVLEQRDDIMQVPNKAIRTSNGQQSVVVLFEGEQITVPVAVGLVGDTMSEITSSQLQEGDVVVIKTSSSNSSATTQNNARQRIYAWWGHDHRSRSWGRRTTMRFPYAEMFNSICIIKVFTREECGGTMKKWVWIIGAVVLMAAVAAGSFWGGMTYQSNKADQARANFETMRGPFAGGQPPSFAQGTQGGGNLGDGTQAGQAFRGAGIIGQIKEIDGDTLTISTAQDVTTVKFNGCDADHQIRNDRDFRAAAWNADYGRRSARRGWEYNCCTNHDR